jgi:bifunctional non-homologous end joining protein LigD
MLLGERLAGGWALVRTGERQWLLIKHRDRWVSTTDPTATHPRSVVSGRTMAEIARAAGASPRQLIEAAAADGGATDARSPVPSPPRPQRRRRAR